jgi:hypothetical protein
MLGPADLPSNRWRHFYAAAFLEHGDNTLRQLKISIAITVCVRRLLEISPEGRSEREQISIALDDLKIHGGLCRKYG